MDVRVGITIKCVRCDSYLCEHGTFDKQMFNYWALHNQLALANFRRNHEALRDKPGTKIEKKLLLLSEDE